MAASDGHLEELLLDDAAARTPTFFEKNKRAITIAAVGLVAVAAIVGIVVGSLASTSKLPAQSASSSGASFEMVDQSAIETRPMFSAPIGSLATAPPPVIYHKSTRTQSARLLFNHTSISKTGAHSHTRLSYDVTKSNHAHCPSTHGSLLAIKCIPDQLRMAFTNDTMAKQYKAAWGNNTLVTLRHEWGCGPHVRRFTSAGRRVGRYVFYHTNNASLADVFQHANISFFTNHSDESGPVNLAPRTTRPASTHTHTHRRGIWSSIMGSIQGISGAVADIANLVVTGNLDVTMQPFSGQYNLQPAPVTNSDQDGGLSATMTLTASGSLTINSNLELAINNYAVSTLDASATATFQASAQADLTAQYQYSTSNSQPLINEVTVASGTVVVFDVPIPVSLLLDVYGGYAVTAQANAALSGSVSATLTATAGIAYDGTNLNPYANANFDGSLNFAQPQATAQAEANVFIAPVTYLQVAYIGGPTATLVLYGDANLQADLQGGTCAVAEVAGVEVDVGAQISVSLPGITSWSQQTSPVPLYGPQTLWQGSASCALAS